MLKNLAIILFFYTLILLEVSFLTHFNFFSNKIFSYFFILFPIILISFFASENKYYDLIAAFSAGLFLDIFSTRPLGTLALLLTLIIFFINFFLKQYINLSIWTDILKTKK